MYCPTVDLESSSGLAGSSDPQDSFEKLSASGLSSAVCIFTDGSVKQGAPFSGFALTSLDGSVSRQYRSASFLSSFCVEVMAILKALLLARAEGWVSVTIFSDSRSALSAVRSRFNPRSSSYLVLRVKSVLLDMERAGTLTRLVWIPSHVGIRGNERADALAKDAIPHGVDSQLRIPLREFKNYWKEDMFTELFD